MANKAKHLGSVAAVMLGTVFPIAILFSSHWFLLAAISLIVAWLVCSRSGRQTWSIACIGIATIPQRMGASCVVVIGIAGVVAVFVALLAMGTGFEATLRQTGSDDTAIVLQSGARSEAGSVIEHEARRLITQAPQILRSAQDRPILSSELVVTLPLQKKSNGLDANVAVRGVESLVWELRPAVRVIAGRRFMPGLRELIAGRGAHEQFRGLEVGSTLTLNGQAWSVVGIFASGDAHNSELWTDTSVMASAFHRESGVNSISVRLTGPQAFSAFKVQLTSDPRLKVDVQTTRQFFSQQSERFSKAVRIVGVTVGIIMALGATFGALNTMYATVIARSREIGTLRALGFPDAAVVGPVLLETLLLAMAGGLIGATIAWLMFDGFTASTVGGSGQVVFAFQVSPALLLEGLKWALAIGLIGGLYPALRAARMPIVASLREQ